MRVPLCVAIGLGLLQVIFAVDSTRLRIEIPARNHNADAQTVGKIAATALATQLRVPPADVRAMPLAASNSSTQGDAALEYDVTIDAPIKPKLIKRLVRDASALTNALRAAAGVPAKQSVAVRQLPEPEPEPKPRNVERRELHEGQHTIGSCETGTHTNRRSGTCEDGGMFSEHDQTRCQEVMDDWGQLMTIINSPDKPAGCYIPRASTTGGYFNIDLNSVTQCSYLVECICSCDEHTEESPLVVQGCNVVTTDTGTCADLSGYTTIVNQDLCNAISTEYSAPYNVNVDQPIATGCTFEEGIIRFTMEGVVSSPNLCSPTVSCYCVSDACASNVQITVAPTASAPANPTPTLPNGCEIHQIQSGTCESNSLALITDGAMCAQIASMFGANYLDSAPNGVDVTAFASGCTMVQASPFAIMINNDGTGACGAMPGMCLCTDSACDQSAGGVESPTDDEEETLAIQGCSVLMTSTGVCTDLAGYTTIVSESFCNAISVEYLAGYTVNRVEQFATGCTFEEGIIRFTADGGDSALCSPTVPCYCVNDGCDSNVLGSSNALTDAPTAAIVPTDDIVSHDTNCDMLAPPLEYLTESECQSLSAGFARYSTFTSMMGPPGCFHSADGQNLQYNLADTANGRCGQHNKCVCADALTTSNDDTPLLAVCDLEASYTSACKLPAVYAYDPTTGVLTLDDAGAAYNYVTADGGVLYDDNATAAVIATVVGVNNAQRTQLLVANGTTHEFQTGLSYLYRVVLDGDDSTYPYGTL
ncbi:hypothetical protein CYMTET_39196 [Cymbomonas tetramitiformis]|uniref:Uncharacterized protein n=1 Tax=Cymbomonas tetramitiformis TaxID=36881 RepID=A0AAE0CBR6_9CHLO|nr:hypothetical protein CYMTET_39196 [Cymbomonas tetramitiformis]